MRFARVVLPDRRTPASQTMGASFHASSIRDIQKAHGPQAAHRFILSMTRSADDLLRVYPQTRLEDDALLERLTQLKEGAYAKRLRERLLRNFGSLKRVSAASVAELRPFVGEKQAERIVDVELSDEEMENLLKEIG